MAISVTNLGTATNNSVATLALTLSTNVQAGATIVVGMTMGDNRTFSAGSNTVADSAGNTYTEIGGFSNAGITGVGFGVVFYAKAIAALSSGDTITITKQSSNTVAMVALAITGVDADPLDTSVTHFSNGSSAAPSNTAGTPGNLNEIIVGILSWQDTTVATFSADAVNGWSGQGSQKTSGAATRNDGVGFGYKIISDGSAPTWAPTLSASNRWASCLIGLNAAAATSVQPSLMMMGVGS